MTITVRLRLSVALSMLLMMISARAVDFYFSPDTAQGNVGDTVMFLGRIGPSDLMRGFTVYLGYDTNKMKLAAAPKPGSLVASRQGLSFFYYDHIPTFPDRLDIGAAVYSTDYWSGPGDLFSVRFVLRGCGDVMIADPYAPRFTAPDGTTMPWSFDSATVLICDRVPEAPEHVTIAAAASVVILRWDVVTTDIRGRSLLAPATYAVFRERLRPTYLPPVQIALLEGTSCADSTRSALACRYYVIARTSEYLRATVYHAP
jgi:hypothetical protein